MSEESQRYYIFVSWKNGYEATKIHENLVNAEGEQALTLSTVRRWIAKFKGGETDIHDKLRSGRPRETVMPENIAKVSKLISNDPHITTRHLEAETGISQARIVYILNSELNMHKVCAKWVPYKLTADHKEKRIELSKQLLEVLEKGYNNIITGDETWMYFFTISNKENNKVWLERGENRPQIVRTAQNSKKRMFCFFYTVDGVVARIVIKKGKTVNGELYRKQILPEVFLKFMEKKKEQPLEMSCCTTTMPHHIRQGLLPNILRRKELKFFPIHPIVRI